MCCTGNLLQINWSLYIRHLQKKKKKFHSANRKKNVINKKVPIFQALVHTSNESNDGFGFKSDSQQFSRFRVCALRENCVNIYKKVLWNVSRFVQCSICNIFQQLQHSKQITNDKITRSSWSKSKKKKTRKKHIKWNYKKYAKLNLMQFSIHIQSYRSLKAHMVMEHKVDERILFFYYFIFHCFRVFYLQRKSETQFNISIFDANT